MVTADVLKRVASPFTRTRPALRMICRISVRRSSAIIPSSGVSPADPPVDGSSAEPSSGSSTIELPFTIEQLRIFVQSRPKTNLTRHQKNKKMLPAKQASRRAILPFYPESTIRPTASDKIVLILSEISNCRRPVGILKGQGILQYYVFQRKCIWHL